MPRLPVKALLVRSSADKAGPPLALPGRLGEITCGASNLCPIDTLLGTVHVNPMTASLAIKLSIEA